MLPKRPHQPTGNQAGCDPSASTGPALATSERQSDQPSPPGGPSTPPRPQTSRRLLQHPCRRDECSERLRFVFVASEPLPQAEYEQIYARVPRLRVEVVVVSANGVLLTRPEEGPWKGRWHIPGGTVRFGERLTDAVLRVARDELRVEVGIDRFLGYVEYPGYLHGGRGWPVGLAFMVQVTPGSAEELRPITDAVGWFEHLPDDMHEEQRGFLQAQHLHVPVRSRHHSELSDPQLAHLADVLRALGAIQPFSASEALSAALGAGVVNTTADIGTAIDDLEDAGVLRQVQRHPPRWEAIDNPG
jgi:ADP-ribose pyrophosphatase YjhB (NUDIX family)